MEQELLISRYPAARSCGQVGVTGVRGGWKVERGVAVKEPERLELKSGGLHGHDGPVFWSRDVGGSEHVPQDDVGITHAAIGGCPVWEAVASGMLIRVIPGRVPLIGL